MLDEPKPNQVSAPPSAMVIPSSSQGSAVIASPQEAMATAKPSVNSRRAWWKNTDRWIAIISIVIGALVSWYFYTRSEIAPRLVFAVHPLKTELQRPDFDDAFAFTYAGNPIESKSVTSLQFGIWNEGTRSIRTEDILEPLKVEFQDHNRILSARIKRVSRDLTRIRIGPDGTVATQTSFDQGTIPVTWRILEPGDGVVVQVIYVGGPDSKLGLVGVITGQPMPAQRFPASMNQVQRTSMRGTWIIPVALALAFGVGLFLFRVGVRRKKLKEGTTFFSIVAVLVCVPPLFGLLFGVIYFELLWQSSNAVIPPFGW